MGSSSDNCFAWHGHPDHCHWQHPRHRVCADPRTIENHAQLFHCKFGCSRFNSLYLRPAHECGLHCGWKMALWIGSVQDVAYQ